MMFKDWKELNIGGYQLKKLVRASDGLILFNKESKPVIYDGCCFWLHGVPAGGTVAKGSYNMVTGSTVGTYIDWGDGTIDHWTASNTTAYNHTYQNAGDYVVRCFGDVQGLVGKIGVRGAYWNFAVADSVEITTNNFAGSIGSIFQNGSNITKISYSDTMIAPSTPVSTTGLSEVEYHLYQNLSLTASSAPAVFGTDANVYIHKGTSFTLNNSTSINLVEFCDDYDSQSQLITMNMNGVKKVHFKKGKSEIKDISFSGFKDTLLKEVIVDDYAFAEIMYNTSFLNSAQSALETVKIGYGPLRFGINAWRLIYNTTAKIYVHGDALNFWKNSPYVDSSMRDRFYAMD